MHIRNRLRRPPKVASSLAALLSMSAAALLLSVPGASAAPSVAPVQQPTATATVLAGPATGGSAPQVAQATVRQGPVTQSTPTPQSASGCNNVVCIYVNGSGLHVNYVDSYAEPTAYTCASARFQVNGVVRASTNVVCGGPYPNQTFYATWNTNSDFANGTQLCVYWLSSNNATPGHPCETVHS